MPYSSRVHGFYLWKYFCWTHLCILEWLTVRYSWLDVRTKYQQKIRVEFFFLKHKPRLFVVYFYVFFLYLFFLEVFKNPVLENTHKIVITNVIKLSLGNVFTTHLRLIISLVVFDGIRQFPSFEQIPLSWILNYRRLKVTVNVTFILFYVIQYLWLSLSSFISSQYFYSVANGY